MTNKNLFFITIIILIIIFSNLFNYFTQNSSIILSTFKASLMVLSITSLFISIFTCLKFINVPSKINFKHDLITIKNDIKNCTITKKTLILSLLSVCVSLMLLQYNFFKFAVSFFLLAFYVMAQNLNFVQNEKAQMLKDNQKLIFLYKTNYSFFYYSNKIIQISFFLYIFYFVITSMLNQSFFHYLESYIAANNEIDFERITTDLYAYYNPLILMFALFLNSTLLDFMLESLLLYSNYELFLAPIPTTIMRRMSKSVLLAGGGIATAGTLISYSPLVEIPGVNEAQIKFGRGYGYQSVIDYTKGSILSSYFNNKELNQFVDEIGPRDRVLNGEFFQKLAKESVVLKKLHEAPQIEKFILGIGRYR
jgi:hypothetical protein